MVSVKQAKLYCCEDISLIENYDEAVSSPLKYDLHHKLGLWFDTQWLIDNGFYYQQRAEMLVFLTHRDHVYLHNKTPNEETRLKISVAKKGCVFTEEHKHKLSVSHKGKRPSEHCLRKMIEVHKGVPLTEEQKQKIRMAQINDVERSKKVGQYTIDGEFIAEYPSLGEIKRKLGFSKSTVSACCNGKRKTAYGFVWKFV